MIYSQNFEITFFNFMLRFNFLRCSYVAARAASHWYNAAAERHIQCARRTA
jgi:hypothetical protein